ncbi:MAG: hypothetical protein RLZZ595_1480 [Bacteroidota bacterium]|jgi:hypothetical protein
MQTQQLPILLYRYFAQRGRVTIPSIGDLVCSKSPSTNDFVVKELKPGNLLYQFSSGDQKMGNEQMDYLVQQSGGREEDVKHSLVMLGEELHEKLFQEKKLEWMGVGSFFVSENGEIQFQTKTNPVELYKTVHYQHVIRQNAVHEMRVGEDQRSTSEMEAYFEDQKSAAGRNQWMKGAMILLGILAIALVVRFSKGSFNLLDGRYNKIELRTPQTTYKVL